MTVIAQKVVTESSDVQQEATVVAKVYIIMLEKEWGYVTATFCQ
jgi:hypothetical protein